MGMIEYMTIGEYIEALYCTGFFGKNKAKFGVKLFEAAGSHVDVTLEPTQSIPKEPSTS